ncbi:MAG: hypothetical protein IJN53_06970 [Oscillospiraceae bacterium]|nr:hypothetical protein [Oscillospiraceae bacterium]
MKITKNNAFGKYLESLSEDQLAKTDALFQDLQEHCTLPKHWAKKLVKDFENALVYYHQSGVAPDEAHRRLQPRKLGGFYARGAAAWFALDDAAKVYPLSMGRSSMAVFRLSAYLKEDVVPALLQMALNFTIKRFPGFATTLKKGFFWHYLDTAKRRFRVDEEHDLPCQPLKVSASGSQSFRVLYWKNRVSVEFFHVLTDGTGGMEFLKVLLGEYIRLLGAEFVPEDMLLDVYDSAAPQETENAFRNVASEKHGAGFVDKTVVQMTGPLAKTHPCRILHIKMDAKKLSQVAKSYGATVTEYLLALMFLAGKAATDELEGQCSIQVPVNMRKFYPSETLRNFSMYCGVRLDIGDITTVEKMLPSIHAQLTEKAGKQPMTQMITSTKKLVSSVRYVPLMVKQPVAKAVYGFLGDKIFSNTLSNLGIVRLPEVFYEYVQSMDFVLGTAMTNRAECTLVTFGDCATFSISKLTRDPSFEEKLESLLQLDGIPFTIEGSGYYGH